MPKSKGTTVLILVVSLSVIAPLTPAQEAQQSEREAMYYRYMEFASYVKCTCGWHGWTEIGLQRHNPVLSKYSADRHSESTSGARIDLRCAAMVEAQHRDGRRVRIARIQVRSSIWTVRARGGAHCNDRLG